MNLHGIVRGAITTVNPDIIAAYYQSTGPTTNADFSRSPSFADPVDIKVQVQALTGKALRQAEFLNLQGTMRSVYAFGDIEAIVRVDNKGGDILRFPQVPGGAVQSWLISSVVETWPDWCHVIATLQVDAGAPA